MLSEAEGRFWSLVERGPGCWTWRGRIDHTGYGRFTICRVQHMAHRLSYSLVVGEIPSGMVIDHVCNNKVCMNPDHLRPVTIRENVLRGIGRSAMNASKRWCPQGHAYDQANTRIDKRGKRACRACERERWHINKPKRKARAALSAPAGEGK